ncbi:restriction endonuclease subunit S [Vibrio campbellii]|uniref:restriction endonuclease subunit S n=1 Tax=Vibrio campbellii TaxID=680 RepID=UPI001D17890A|nr:restriction endonuclease subunit S [Vibrio campbellii]MCC4225971.1 restriction endonuclease subunit S [Vibrio campbellii]
MSGREFPILRFKAFSGPWGKADFKEIAKGFNYGMNASAVTFNGKDKYIRITDIDDSLNTFSPSPLTSPEGGGREKYKLNTGDIVFARTGASTGKPYLYSKGDGELFFAGFLIKATITKGNPSFIYQFCKTSTYTRWVSVMSMRSGQPGINAEEYKGLCIPFPDEREQQKIADFLTSVDTKISQLTEKHRLLKKYKKGVMQQIFSQKICFRDDDGEAFPKWTENRLDYFIERVSDPVDVVAGVEYREIGIRSHGKGVFHKNPVTGSDIGNKRVFWVKEKALVLNIVFAWERAVAVTSDSESGFIASHRFPMYLPKENRADVNYLLYFLLSPRGTRLLNIASPGGAGRNKTLGQSEFAKLKVCLPSIKEQQKITQFLQAIDSKIEGVGTQLEQIKQFKKGLLQQMFV